MQATQSWLKNKKWRRALCSISSEGYESSREMKKGLKFIAQEEHSEWMWKFSFEQKHFFHFDIFLKVLSFIATAFRKVYLLVAINSIPKTLTSITFYKIYRSSDNYVNNLGSEL